HLNDYEQHKPSEHLEVGEGSKIHLLQIAFNAMMEYYYCLQEEKPLTQIVEEGVDSCDTLSHKTE
ncbi:MAG: hypothetical protein ACREHG_03310, partial [Candidatus Saccharimonadales bacterium]